jgi:hypothetical protein
MINSATSMGSNQLCLFLSILKEDAEFDILHPHLFSRGIEEKGKGIKSRGEGEKW